MSTCVELVPQVCSIFSIFVIPLYIFIHKYWMEREWNVSTIVIGFMRRMCSDDINFTSPFVIGVSFRVYFIHRMAFSFFVFSQYILFISCNWLETCWTFRSHTASVYFQKYHKILKVQPHRFEFRPQTVVAQVHRTNINTREPLWTNQTTIFQFPARVVTTEKGGKCNSKAQWFICSGDGLVTSPSTRSLGPSFT